MTTDLKRQTAQQLYDGGYSFYQQSNYGQAIVELRKAEYLFRALDAQGHPFNYSLANKVSGLANTLALEGRCYLHMGEYRKAIPFYESSLINEKFERKRPFQRFQSDLRTELATCYEKELEKIDPEKLRMLKQAPPIDISFRFPFSLPQELIPVARLYELTPERYPHTGGFYGTARNLDNKLRQLDKVSDGSAMKKLSFYVWGTLVSIWIAYGLFAFRALVHRN
jgi:tetratricopeptide (TPR) repeat protein